MRKYLVLSAAAILILALSIPSAALATTLVDEWTYSSGTSYASGSTYFTYTPGTQDYVSKIQAVEYGRSRLYRNISMKLMSNGSYIWTYNSPLVYVYDQNYSRYPGVYVTNGSGSASFYRRSTSTSSPILEGYSWVAF